jgi:hypothetical protein
MGRVIGVTLNWESPLEDWTTLHGRPGICTVFAGRRRNGAWDEAAYHLLDIARVGGGAPPVFTPDREASWERTKPADSSLLFGFAAMPDGSHDALDRQIVECCLRSHHRPLAYVVECASHGSGHIVAISNTGHFAPLQDRYICGRH